MRPVTWLFGIGVIACFAIGAVLPLSTAGFDSPRSPLAITGTPAVQIFGPAAYRPALPGQSVATPTSVSPDATPTNTPPASPTSSPTSTRTATPTSASPTPSPTPGQGGPVKLVALGDSLTSGDGDSQGIGYPGRLILQIAALRPGSTIQNFGRSGWTSTELITGTNGEPGQLDPAIATQPSIALFWIGSNDLWQLYDLGAPNQADEDQDLANFSANINLIMTRLRAAGIKIVVAQHDDQAKRPGATTASLPGITDAEFVRMSLQVVRYNEAIRQRALQHGTAIVNFYPTTIFTDAATISEDGIHPNAAGYDIIAQMWLNAILPLLP